MKFYRYRAVQYADIDMFGEFSSSSFLNPSIVLDTYNLVKETPKGYWIAYGGVTGNLTGEKRWISKTSRKRYAYPSKEEAMVNFIKRTESRINILQKQVDFCKSALSIAKSKK